MWFSGSAADSVRLLPRLYKPAPRLLLPIINQHLLSSPLYSPPPPTTTTTKHTVYKMKFTLATAALFAAVSAIPAPSGGTPGTSGGGGTAPTVAGCSNAQCCKFYTLRDDLKLNVFQSCNDNARAAIRLAFHDAGAYTQAGGVPVGGADGSIMIQHVFDEEINRAENNGLQDIIGALTPYMTKYPQISMGDLVQFAGMQAVLICPGGPKANFFAGRKNPSGPGPDGLLPPVSGSASELIKIFADKGFSSSELVALVGSHSTAKALKQPNFPAFTPQDTTPEIWDVKFYNETLQEQPLAGTGRFQSDSVLARDSRTSQDWISFANSQGKWTSAYAAAHTKMSLLGFNRADLVDCTEALPRFIPIV